MSKYDHLRKAAEDAARLHRGVVGAGLDQGGLPTPEHTNDDVYADNVGFADTPSGQMTIRDRSTPDVYAVGRGTVAKENDDGTIGYHPAGEETEPYRTRPVIPGKQLALGKSGAFRPTDPATHAIRLQNPHLNDYEFHVFPNTHGYHTVQAYHVETTPTPDGPARTRSSAGSFSWKSARLAERSGTPERAGEVSMIDVKDQHRGRGLATAMWDYAHFHAGRDDAAVNHPMHSDDRSIEGNHWAHFVGGASMARTRGFGIQRYE